MADSNKRKHPRVEGKGVAAYLRLNGHNAGCTVQNISVGGVFVRTDRFLPVGTKLAFDLVKPGMKKALTVSGWVVGVITPELAARTKLPQGLRIQFGKMNPVASEALQELVGSLRRTPDGQLQMPAPVLYPIEQKVEQKPKKGGSGVKKEPRAAGLTSLPVRRPSKALGDEPASSTEVEMEARPEARNAGDDDPSVVRRWFKEGDQGGPQRGGGGSGEQPMIDDSLIDAAGDPVEEPRPAAASEEEAPQDEQEQEPGVGEEFDLPPEMMTEPPPGPNPFDDEDMTIGAEPTRAKARYGGGESSKRPTAPRPPPPRARTAAEEERGPGDAGEGGQEALAELEGANHELQRLLERREGEIASLRAQVKTLEAALKEREEQLQLAKRVLKTNGLG
ncbi:MAG TPA: PilZ domain-containing protein [Myxococcaceae bacterium]|jgi:Tfp pilus assembly protein PilZ